MDFLTTIEYFIANEGPWAILFVSLFAWTMRAHNKRETIFSDKLDSIQKDTTLMLETWKLIIERELERREKQ